mmetsp:Transcript_14904/g.31191  ORF Transcript_14904/g.31191 Transcript_14904/m.31191 type:complete len:216 (-) Transcript_14904:423-1070(-)
MYDKSRREGFDSLKLCATCSEYVTAYPAKISTHRISMGPTGTPWMQRMKNNSPTMHSRTMKSTQKEMRGSPDQMREQRKPQIQLTQTVSTVLETIASLNSISAHVGDVRTACLLTTGACFARSFTWSSHIRIFSTVSSSVPLNEPVKSILTAVTLLPEKLRSSLLSEVSSDHHHAMMSSSNSRVGKRLPSIRRFCNQRWKSLIQHLLPETPSSGR